MKNTRFRRAAVVCSLLIAAGIILSRLGSDANDSESEKTLSQSPKLAVSGAESPDGPAPDQYPSGERVDPVVSQNDHAALRQALSEIQADPDATERPGMLLDLLNEEPLELVRNVLAVSDDSQNYSVGFRNDIKMAAFERWYALDPAAAIRAADASTLTENQKVSRIEVYLDDWSSKSPQDVLAFMEQGELTGVSADVVYSAIARGSAQQGDRAAVDFALEQIQDTNLRTYAVKSIARAFPRDQEGQFESWLAALPVEDQGVAIAENAWMLSSSDMDRALRELERLEDVDAANVPVTRSRVVVRWAEDDPVKAADWVAAQNISGDDREVLFSNVISVWVSKDRSAAVAWVEALIEKGTIDEAFMNRVAERM